MNNHGDDMIGHQRPLWFEGKGTAVRKNPQILPKSHDATSVVGLSRCNLGDVITDLKLIFAVGISNE